MDIAKKVYECFSFEAGGKPNFDDLRKLFITNGLMINNKSETPQIRTFCEYESFILHNIELGNIISILEVEIDQKCEQYGKVANIASEYELTFESPAGKQTRYGVNVFQLVRCNNDWLISSMSWDDAPQKGKISCTKGA